MFQIHPNSESSTLQWYSGTRLKAANEKHCHCHILHVFRHYCTQCADVLVWFASAELHKDFYYYLFFCTTTKFWFVGNDRTCVVLYIRGGEVVMADHEVMFYKGGSKVIMIDHDMTCVVFNKG